MEFVWTGLRTVGRRSSTLLNSGSGEDTDGNGIRLSMEFDIVELGNVGTIVIRSHRWSLTLLNLERRRLNVELKGTAGSPGCDTGCTELNEVVEQGLRPFGYYPLWNSRTR